MKALVSATSILYREIFTSIDHRCLYNDLKIANQLYHLSERIYQCGEEIFDGRCIEKISACMNLITSLMALVPAGLRVRTQFLISICLKQATSTPTISTLWHSGALTLVPISVLLSKHSKFGEITTISTIYLSLRKLHDDWLDQAEDAGNNQPNYFSGYSYPDHQCICVSKKLLSFADTYLVHVPEIAHIFDPLRRSVQLLESIKIRRPA